MTSRDNETLPTESSIHQRATSPVDSHELISTQTANWNYNKVVVHENKFGLSRRSLDKIGLYYVHITFFIIKCFNKLNGTIYYAVDNTK